MRVISYNLRKHRAASELAALVHVHDPDVLCLQEVDVEALPEHLGDLTLAHGTMGNRLGLAVYVRRNSYTVLGTKTIGLKKSLHDRVLKPAHERVLAVHLHDIDDNIDLVVASFHAAPLTARNSLRREQIRVALEELESLGENLPRLLVGDFNYPVFKERLSEDLRTSGYELIMADTRTYARYRVFRGFYDFATAIGFTVDSVTTLPQGSSDHLPILVIAHPDGRSSAGGNESDEG